MSIILDHLSYTFPGSLSPLLEDVTVSLSGRRVGIVGRNGSGKTTLLRLLMGELRPSSGSIHVDGPLGYLPQDVVRASNTLGADDRRLVDLLGIAKAADALTRIETGSVEPADFDAVGDGWDICERAQALLARHVPSLGSPPDLSRTAATLSGGEILLVAILGLLLRGHRTIVLDEPTNNLDATSRQRFYDLVAEWPGQVLVVSHDLALLDRVEQIAEVRNRGVRVFDGNYGVFTQAIAREQEAVARDVRDAEREERIARQTRIDTEIRMSRENRMGKRQLAERKHTQKMAGELGNRMQQRHGALRKSVNAAEADARAAREAAEHRLRDDDPVFIDLPDPGVAAARELAELHHAGPLSGGVLRMKGPERIALIGNNGVGKSTLLNTLLGGPRRLPAYGVPRTDRIGYLGQKLDDLPDQQAVLDTIRDAAPHLATSEIRNRLARFLIRRDDVHRAVGTLSGGERFRVALARLLLTEPAHQLLLLDEPTNNLDIDTVSQLVEALSAYRGGILVVSHDVRFLTDLGVSQILELDRDGTLREVAA